MVLFALWACTELPVTPPEEVPDTTAPERPWGVTATCDAPQTGEGFSPIYADGTAILVHGDSPEDEALGARVYGWYADAFDELQARAASELTEEERAEDLMIVGTPSTNPLLSELNGSLAVWFDEGSFSFGKYTYDEPGNGIALQSPNPFGDGSSIVVYAGNTLDGAFSTFTIPTGDHDYHTTRGRGVTLQEGDLCRDNWQWYRKYDDDQREPWDAFVSELEVATTDHLVLYFEPGSDGDADRDWYPDWQEQRYLDALALLEVDALDFRVDGYLYTDRAQKTEMTGNSGNAQANDLNYEVHALYGEGIYAVGAHEYVHVIAWHRIGETQYALTGEGLAVWADGYWAGETLADWASAAKASGDLPPLQALIDDFWSMDDLVTYGAAGHFVGYLEATYGIEAVKELYVAEDLAAAFADRLGRSVPELEADWLASIP